MAETQTQSIGSWLTYLEVIFESLTIIELVTILVQLGFARSQFQGIDGVLYHLQDLQHNPACFDDLGSTLELAFIGGPPGEADWYDGTLLTWAVDAVLYEFADTEGDDGKAMSIVLDVEDIWRADCDNEWDEVGA